MLRVQYNSDNIIDSFENLALKKLASSNKKLMIDMYYFQQRWWCCEGWKILFQLESFCINLARHQIRNWQYTLP